MSSPGLTPVPSSSSGWGNPCLCVLWISPLCLTGESLASDSFLEFLSLPDVLPFLSCLSYWLFCSLVSQLESVGGSVYKIWCSHINNDTKVSLYLALCQQRDQHLNNTKTVFTRCTILSQQWVLPTTPVMALVRQSSSSLTTGPSCDGLHICKQYTYF